MRWVLFVGLVWIISCYSSLLDIVIQVTPYVAWIPFSRVTAASWNCVCEFFLIFFLKRIQDEAANLFIITLFSIVKEKGCMWQLITRETEGSQSCRKPAWREREGVETTYSFPWCMQKAKRSGSPWFGKTWDLRSPCTTQPWGWLVWSLPAQHGQGLAAAFTEGRREGGKMLGLCCSRPFLWLPLPCWPKFCGAGQGGHLPLACLQWHSHRWPQVAALPKDHTDD